MRNLKHAVNKLPGILKVSANYEEGTAYVRYDDSKINRQDIIGAIDATGYKVVTEK